MNSLPKYVVSTTLSEVTWNATLIKGDLTEELPRLKQEAGQDILIFGSGQLVHALNSQGLIDEYRLMVFPVVLGSEREASLPVMRAACACVSWSCSSHCGHCLKHTLLRILRERVALVGLEGSQVYLIGETDPIASRVFGTIHRSICRVNQLSGIEDENTTVSWWARSLK